MRSHLLAFLNTHRSLLLDLRDVLIAAILMVLLGIVSSYYLQRQLPPSRTTAGRAVRAGLMDCGPLCSIPIVAGASGRVRTIYVHDGASVRRGDVLLQLDTRELQDRLSILERRIHVVEVAIARTTISRGTTLARLYRELRQTRLDLDGLTITSPHDGQILAVAPFQSGALLSAGAAIALLRIRLPTPVTTCGPGEASLPMSLQTSDYALQGTNVFAFSWEAAARKP